MIPAFHNREHHSPVEHHVFLVRVGIAIVMLLFLILPFHYVLDPFAVVPKKHWGFSQTIVTSGWVKNTIYTYNNSGTDRKQEIMQNPLVTQLLDRKLIYLSDTK